MPLLVFQVRHSRTLHFLVLFTHAAAIVSVAISAVVLIAKLLLVTWLLVALRKANRELAVDAVSRIRKFTLCNEYCELSLGEGGEQDREYGCGQDAFRSGLPQCLFFSEYLLLLRFPVAGSVADSVLQEEKILLVIPGVLSEEDSSRLRAWLRFSAEPA